MIDVERPGLVNVPGSEILFDTLELTFNLKECPYGFTFNLELKLCVCESTLLNHKVRCDSQTLKMYRL